MEIKLNTGKHCIETAAKRAYEDLLNQYFKSNTDEAGKQSMETEIEALKFFLEHADAKALRSTYAELEKGGSTDVILKVDLLNQQMILQFTTNTIHPPRKKNT